MQNNNNRITALIMVSTSIIAAALVLAGTFIPASAFHNEHGHEFKPSVGDCKRGTGDKEFCQDPESKESFREDRKDLNE